MLYTHFMTIEHNKDRLSGIIHQIPGKYKPSFLGLPIGKYRDIRFTAWPEQEPFRAPRDKVEYSLGKKRVAHVGPTINEDPILRKNGFRWTPTSEEQAAHVRNHWKRYGFKRQPKSSSPVR